MPHLNSQ